MPPATGPTTHTGTLHPGQHKGAPLTPSQKAAAGVMSVKKPRAGGDVAQTVWKQGREEPACSAHREKGPEERRVSHRKEKGRNDMKGMRRIPVRGRECVKTTRKAFTAVGTNGWINEANGGWDVSGKDRVRQDRVTPDKVRQNRKSKDRHRQTDKNTGKQTDADRQTAADTDTNIQANRDKR
ncbi:hypothetical protein Pcinc_018462 [Petrolisthes cinctipes]|uniref:Uncharacterized protein n=1 Tax=Petrolisthes cinctipes TaxID=88211 RepID=A0AAE1FNN6_PETCI|nr:hypothetical protein Pcinc_018462 [Petrolisthes cinctipes]